MSVSGGLKFFDTNLLLYIFAAGDPRQEIAKQTSEEGGVISVQVLNEFVNVSRNKLKLDWQILEERLRRVHRIFQTTISLTEEIQRHAVHIARRYGYDIYDANIIACALAFGCDTLYTEDLHSNQQIESLTIRNPFTALA